MTKSKYLGIWMDHARANLMECTTEPIQTITIECGFTHEVKTGVLDRGETMMHNKQKQQQAAYYKKLGEAIVNYDSVILFGPTNAKVELLNTLKEDLHFKDIKIEVTGADKMTENQQHAFVRDYFSKN